MPNRYTEHRTIGELVSADYIHLALFATPGNKVYWSGMPKDDADRCIGYPGDFVPDKFRENPEDHWLVEITISINLD